MGVELTSLRSSVFRSPGRFVISRGAKTEAVVVDRHLARRRGRRTRRMRALCALRRERARASSRRSKACAGGSRRARTARARGRMLPAGAARNAVDCALWDLEAKRSGVAGLSAPDFQRLEPLTTAYTLSVGAPDEMRAAAEKARIVRLLKVKLAGEGDAERLIAVRAGAPEARLIVDANEAWRERDLLANLESLRARREYLLVEQPLPAGQDDDLGEDRSPRADLRRRERARPREPCRAGQGAMTRSTSSSTRPAGSPRRWPWRKRRGASALRFWPAAWSARLSPWLPPR